MMNRNQFAILSSLVFLAYFTLYYFNEGSRYNDFIMFFLSLAISASYLFILMNIDKTNFVFCLGVLSVLFLTILLPLADFPSHLQWDFPFGLFIAGAFFVSLNIYIWKNINDTKGSP
jgi:hypothetical protein